MSRMLLAACALCCAVAAEPAPPVAKKVPVERKIHGDALVDNYRWLQDKKSAEVIAYLNAENAYTQAMTKHLKDFEERLYQETLARIKQTDLSVPVPERGYVYYTRTEKGKQYPVRCRKKDDPKAVEEVLLDGNEMAKGHKFFSLGQSQVSDDNRLLAYVSDVTGFREYYLSVKDLTTGKLLEDRTRKVASFAWAADNKTLFYVTEDAAKRPHKLWRHTVGSDKDVPVYEEKDELFRLGVSRSRDRQYLFAGSRSSTTTEVRYYRSDLDWDAWRVVRPREEGHEYTVESRHEVLWIRTNKGAKGFRVVTAMLTEKGPAEWKEAFSHKDGVTIENVIPFARYIVLAVRENGLRQIDVYDTETLQTHRIDWPEPVFTAFATPTPEFDTDKLRLSYTSLVTPSTVYEYDMKTKARKVLKREEVLGGYDPEQYHSERIWATAKDGVKVPISLVYRKGVKLDGTAPLWLSGYGSYGASSSVGFSPRNLPILDRGVILATAHIRGGGDMGKTWHDDGKMMKKMNTFSDFIACADHLVEKKYTSRDRLAIEGASAGGLLIGAVVNLRPDLCKVAVLGVPFVDVINTMLDPSLPLTIQEYLEWGNPNKKAEYDYMKAYCPYTNLRPTAYPAMLVVTSLNDSQVMYWEPAKYVAKLRSLKTGTAPLLLKVNMAAGHGGASGRYDSLREQAFKKAFVLEQLGVHPGAWGRSAPNADESRPASAWRALPLIKDDKVAPDWAQIGWGGFAVDGGALRTDCDERGMGLLLYKKEKFGDCQIRVVYRCKGGKSNSGVFVRIDDGVLAKLDEKAPAVHRDKDGKLSEKELRKMMDASEKELGPWYPVHHGYEVQICDDADAAHRTGCIYSLSKAAAVPEKRPGEWRTLVITLRGNVIEVDLDGKRVSRFDPESKDVPADRKWYEPKREPRRPKVGYIGLQNHDPGDVVWFREVSVRPLEKSP